MSTELIRELASLRQRLAALERQEAILRSTGTFTPTFAGSATPGSCTYVAGRRDGSYVREGNRVTFALELAISAIPTAPTGNMTITGLPFPAAGSQDGAVWFGLIANVNLSAGASMLTGFIPAGTSVITLYEAFDNAGSTPMPAVNFTNVFAQLRLWGMYWIA